MSGEGRPAAGFEQSRDHLAPKGRASTSHWELVSQFLPYIIHPDGLCDAHLFLLLLPLGEVTREGLLETHCFFEEVVCLEKESSFLCPKR